MVKWIKKKLLEKKAKKYFIKNYLAVRPHTDKSDEEIIKAICTVLNEYDKSGIWTATCKNADCYINWNPFKCE